MCGIKVSVWDAENSLNEINQPSLEPASDKNERRRSREADPAEMPAPPLTSRVTVSELLRRSVALFPHPSAGVETGLALRSRRVDRARMPVEPCARHPTHPAHRKQAANRAVSVVIRADRQLTAA